MHNRWARLVVMLMILPPLVLVLASCSINRAGNPGVENANAVATSYVDSLNSEEQLIDHDTAEAKYLEITGKKLDLSSAPFKTIQALPEDKQKELTDFFRAGYDSNLFVYDGMSTSEQATLDVYLSMAHTMIRELGIHPDFYGSDVKEPAKVNDDTNTALVLPTIKLGKGDTEISLPALKLRVVDNTWRIDAKHLFSEIGQDV